MIICPECGKGIDEHLKECPNCGYPFNGKEKHVKGKVCPDCGREVPKEEKECPYCGFDFEQAEEVEETDDSNKKFEIFLQKSKKSEKTDKQREKKQPKRKKRLRNIGIVITCILAFFIAMIVWGRSHPHLIYVIDNEGLMYSLPWNSTEYEVEQKMDDTSEKGTWNNSKSSHKYVVSSPYFLAISGLNGKISLIFHKNADNVMLLENATIEFSAEKDCRASKSDIYQKLKDQYDERFGKSDDGINWATEKSNIKISGINLKGDNLTDIKIHISEKNEKTERKKEQNTTSSQSLTEMPKQEQSESLETFSTSSDESSSSSNTSIDWNHIAVVPGSSDDEELGSLLWTNGTVYGIPWYSTYSELPEKVKQWGQIVEYDELSNYICNDRGTYEGIPGTHVELAMIFGGSPGAAKLDFASITISKDDTCEYSDDKLLHEVLVDLVIRYGNNYKTSSDGALLWNTKSGSSVIVQYDKNHNLNIALGVSKSS